MADTYLNKKGAQHRAEKTKEWADARFVRYTTYNAVGVAGNGKNVSVLSPQTLFVPDGLIMGGTALSAGLVTRGICGVTTPDGNGGCTKENLYLNYDGNNNYSRKVVLGAGGAGNEIANSSGAYTYSAVRGDQMVSYVTNYVPGAIKTWFDSNVHIPSIKTLNTNNSSTLPVSSSEARSGSGSINLHKVSKTGKFSDLNNRGEAFLSWGGQNFVGAYGPIDSAMIPDLGANRLAFMPPAGISVEYSRDSGTTWQDYGATDAQKLGLTSTGANFIIGKADSSNKATERYMLRISIHTSEGKVYTQLNKFALYISTSGSNGSYCTIRARTQNNYLNKVDKWDVFANKQSIAGWSGWNIINTSTITTYGNTASSQYGEIQFIFGCTSGSTSYVGLQIQRLMGFGGVGWQTPSNMAKYGTIYSYDYNQNAIFPKNLVVNGTISEGGTPLANKYLGKAIATTTVLGGVKSKATGTTANRNYNVEVNSDGTMKVNVPWTDTNTSHSHSAGVGLVGSGSAGTSGTYTYKAKLRSETALTVDSATATTSGNVYPVAVDKSGYLSLNVPLAGFEDILKGIKGRTQVEWNALNAGEYGSNSTYNGATLPPVLLENTSGFWNSASGRPLDISFHFTKKERITTLQVKCPPYSGVNPTMAVYYAQKGDTGLTLYKEIATISTADRKAYEFNEEGISADYWVVRFTSSGWIDLRLCSPSGLFTTGLYTEECHQQIMDRFNGYQPVGNYQPKGDYVTYDNASKDIYLGSHGIHSGTRPSSGSATLMGNGYWIKPSSVGVSSAVIGGTVPSVSSEMTPDYVSVSNGKIKLNSSGIVSDEGTFTFDGNPGSVATSADLRNYQKKGNYVTIDTAQTITGRKTFNSPANVNGQEVATAIFKTSNGGQLIIGKEGPNSGTMLRFDQTAGKTRLQFRASATLGAMVWTQPEKGAKLYFDLTNSAGVSTRTTLDARSGTIARTSDIGNGKITIQKNGTEVGSFTTNQSGSKTIDLTLDVSDVSGLKPTLDEKMDTYTITSSPSSMGKDGFAQFGYDIIYGLTKYSQLTNAFGYVKVLEKGGEVSNNNSHFTGFGNVGGGTYIGTATYDRDYNFPDAALVASRGLLIDNYGSAFLLYGSRDSETKKELATKDDINSLQNSINGKANKTHTHAISDITNLQSTLNDKANIGHGHAISAITNLESILNGKQATLVSGTNIRTINGNSILGSGNLSIFASLTEKEFHDIINATSSMSSYIVIDKLLIQWGVYIGASGDTTNWEVTYPKEFWYYPAVILQTKDTITNNQGIPYSNGAVITSYRGGKAFTFQLRRSEKCPVYWIAIGGLR